MDFNKPIILDGAMGTILYSIKDLKFSCPEELNITNPHIIEDIHKQYIKSGAMIIQTNTFGANREKLSNFGLEDKIEGINLQAVKLARRACWGQQALVAVSLGPTGKLIEPFGDTSFDTAYNIYKEQVKICLREKPDLFIIETMSQINEAKAAILAVKDSCSLPIFCTMTFEDNNKTLMGTSPEVSIITLQALGISAFGANCSTGPQAVLEAIKSMSPFARVPLIAQPNGGIPTEGSMDLLSSSDMLQWYSEINNAGASILGGCCGTTYQHISKLSQACATLKVKAPLDRIGCIATSNWDLVKIGKNQPPVIIGERINPTGKSRLIQSLSKQNYNEVITEALEQQRCGCHILDVNVGFAQGDEVQLLRGATIHIQNSVTLPLQFDSLDAKALEGALKVYSGRAIINSTTAKDKSLDTLLPLAKRYGAVIIGLTMEDGIAQSPRERFDLAKKIITRAKDYDLSSEDIIIDPLITSASSDYTPYTALEAAVQIAEDFDCPIIGGISNCSFGLPFRENINRAMTVLALNNGFNGFIVNPKDKELMGVLEAGWLILSKGLSLHSYLKTNKTNSSNMDYFQDRPLSFALFQGNLHKSLEIITNEQKEPSKIITEDIIPVFDVLSNLYDKGDIYLPQLLASSRAASEVITNLDKGGTESRGCKILLATVEGDYHDIGKSMAALMLRANGFDVIDLGKGVSSDVIVTQVNNLNIALVGLSCLMTSTLPYLENTVREIIDNCPDTQIMAGGAVITEEYCKRVGIHYYCPKAIDGLKIAKAVFYKL
jgi:5-methyltetrahydrofolate--homocysteine methyltransferase